MSIATDPRVKAIADEAFDTISRTQPHMLRSPEMRAFLENVLRAYLDGKIAALTSQRDAK